MKLIQYFIFFEEIHLSKTVSLHWSRLFQRYSNTFIFQVNLNNIQNVNMEVFEELASALEGNHHVKHLSLANVGLTDKPAKAMATMLKHNNSLEILNVESNFITG